MTETFGRAALAVVDGDLETLRRLLAARPELLHERSDDDFRATLLHHVAANGVPDNMQRTPANAVEVCECRLDAGAEIDGLDDDGAGVRLHAGGRGAARLRRARALRASACDGGPSNGARPVIASYSVAVRP